MLLCDVILPFFWLPVCQTDETLSGYAPRGQVYVLEEMAGVAPLGTVTLEIPGRKQMRLRTPCFGYEGQQRLPYPWFEFELKDTVAYSCIETPLEEAVFAIDEDLL